MRTKERDKKENKKGERKRERKGKKMRKKATASHFCFFSGMDPPPVCPPDLKMRRRGQRRRR